MNILITGGASGLGEEITKDLAINKDNKVYFTYNNSKDKALALESEFTNTIGIKCDFNNSTELENLLTSMADFDISVLINNAYKGPIESKYFHKSEAENFLNSFETNVIPMIRITQAAIRLFRKQKNGRIITVLTSYLYNNPPMGMSIYAANKAYIEKLTKVWANENIKFNISSNSVSPSIMQTELTSDVDERVLEQMTTSHPLKKLLTTHEVAKTITFLTTSSHQLNGVDIPLNSGVNIK